MRQKQEKKGGGLGVFGGGGGNVSGVGDHGIWEKMFCFSRGKINLGLKKGRGHDKSWEGKNKSFNESKQSKLHRGP